MYDTTRRIEVCCNRVLPYSTRLISFLQLFLHERWILNSDIVRKYNTIKSDVMAQSTGQLRNNPKELQAQAEMLLHYHKSRMKCTSVLVRKHPDIVANAFHNVFTKREKIWWIITRCRGVNRRKIYSEIACVLILPTTASSSTLSKREHDLQEHSTCMVIEDRMCLRSQGSIS